MCILLASQKSLWDLHFINCSRPQKQEGGEQSELQCSRFILRSVTAGWMLDSQSVRAVLLALLLLGYFNPKKDT